MKSIRKSLATLLVAAEAVLGEAWFRTITSEVFG